MSFTLPPLPYQANEFKNLSEEAFNIHHGKHHATYVNNLNKLVTGTEFATMALEDIIKATYGKADKKGIFNNAGQHFNHSFYWKSITPTSGPCDSSLKIYAKIVEDFGSYDAFVEQFVQNGATHFGSGWVWLVWDPNTSKLKVISTHDGDCPIVDGVVPILTIDVWEHAYYLNYQNRRLNFLQDLVNGNMNWAFAEENFLKAAKQ